MSSLPPPPPGGPTPPTYGAPAPGAVPPNHPKAVLALVLSIVSWFVCGLLLSVPAFIIARNAERETLASNGTIGGEGMLKAAKIIALIQIILSIVAIVVVVILVAAGAFDSSTNTSTGY
ncbi:DUF4190 domain-containing protein [Nocardioides jiangxiensis]|uniref:DUF4190 domain-containing protein n=1 Tax=Nocardioides jiangxiensis TaxID=3064524 RepID=A0ABT9B7X2_9ACTN|nr:DUF4190 domain-containing protein [Nocardioides sp. WY-20]MDO7869386.1 DUF4190 domain-containing protein [Nocardioides sp. WY-20]